MGLKRTRREGPLTAQMASALQWIASRGDMRVARENRFIYDEISARTAWSLERRGLVERRWAGGREGYVYITDEGRRVADEELGVLDEDDET